MQLTLIIQVSIALLAGELAGSAPEGAWSGAWTGFVALLLAPAVVLARGLLLARRAHREMDRGRADALERLYAATPRSAWIVTALMLLAAMGAFPNAAAAVIGHAGVAIAFLAAVVLSRLAEFLSAWSVEKRIRESLFIRELDALRPVHPMPSRAGYVLAQARASLLPVLAPLVVPVLLSEIGREVAEAWWPAHVEYARFAGGLAGVAGLFVLVPLFVPMLLGLRRLPEGELRDELAELAGGAGVRLRELWVWPTDGLIANAAVMGVVPGLRCVMLSDCMLECMPREPLRAVLAHELGHVVHRHLVWMLVMILAAWTVANLAISPVVVSLAEEFALRNPGVSEAAIVESASILRDAAVLVAGLLGFGYLSRRVERQADTFAVQLLSRIEGSATASERATGAMVDALHGVAVLNHVAPERPSWRHGSIAWRQAYLRSIRGEPIAGMPIDRTMAVLRWGAFAVLVAGSVLGLAAR